jgi:hypothetical protein
MSLAAAPQPRALACRRSLASAPRPRASALPSSRHVRRPVSVHASFDVDTARRPPRRDAGGRSFAPGGGKAGGKASAEALVNEALRACLTAESLLSLVDCCLTTGKSPDGLPVRFDPANASTALVTLSRVASARQREDGSLRSDPRFEALLRALETQMPRLWASSGANAMFALGRLGVVPRATFLDAFWQISATKHFQTYLPGNYAALLSACAALELQPPEAWLDAFWRGSSGLADDFEGRQFAMMVHGAGTMQLAPPAHWTARVLAASAERMGTMKAAELAELAAGLGKLQVRPTRSWTEAFGTASGPQLARMSEPALVATLLAAARLGITPPEVWLTAFWEALLVVLRNPSAAITPQMIAEIASSAALLRTPMPADVAAAFLARAAAGCSAMSPVQLADVARCVAVLGLAPPMTWQRALGSALAASPEAFTPSQLADFAAALTVCAAWDAPASPAVFQLLVDALAVRAGTGWDDADVAAGVAMYDMLQAASLERPGGLHRPGLGLMAAASDAWAAQQAAAETEQAATEFHAEVAEALGLLGVAHAVSERCAKCERCVDFAIDSGAEGVGRIALVAAAGAPSQALADGSPGGAATLRDRMLKAAGWRVAPLDAREWETATAAGEEAQHDLLRFILAPLGVRFQA